MAKKKPTNVSNFHVQYLDVTSQYWHPQSAQFAGCDNLLTALEQGWEIVNFEVATHDYAGARYVKIYEFTLRSGNRQMTMPVIDNPYLQRWLRDEGYDLSQVGF